MCQELLLCVLSQKESLLYIIQIHLCFPNHKCVYQAFRYFCHFIRWDQFKTTQSEKRGGGLARVGAAKRAGYCDPPPHLSHNRNDRRIHTPVTITLLQPAGSFVVGVATHHCHHLHPLTDLAGSTLSDHFRDVNDGEKNHSSSALEILPETSS